MAIDSAAKRQSAFLDEFLILPDVSGIEVSDRLALLGHYAGIAAGSGVTWTNRKTLTFIPKPPVTPSGAAPNYREYERWMNRVYRILLDTADEDRILGLNSDGTGTGSLKTPMDRPSYWIGK